MIDKIKLIHLHHCRGAGWGAIRKVLVDDPSLSSLYSRPDSYWQELLRPQTSGLREFLEDLHSLDILSLLRQYKQNNIDCISYYDSDYPPMLAQIYDPPWILYIRGDRRLLNEVNVLGAAGSRKPSVYGIEALKRLIPPLAAHGYTIVSGLAAGIDAMSHELALSAGGKTIGVLGGGHYHLYPKSSIPLAVRMMKAGLVISETIPDRRPERWMFPMRNRIISGLSRAVLIAEAAENSGSLITAQSALDQGRDVFAVPGSPSNQMAAGANRLIQEGAKLVMTPSDIIEELPLVQRER